MGPLPGRQARRAGPRRTGRGAGAPGAYGARTEDQVADRDLVLIRRVLAQGWRYRWMILLSLLASVATGALSGFLFAKLGPFLKFMGQAATSQAATGSDRAELAVATAGLTALGFLLVKLAPVAGAASYLSWWSGQWVANRSMRDLRDRVHPDSFN